MESPLHLNKKARKTMESKEEMNLDHKALNKFSRQNAALGKYFDF